MEPIVGAPRAHLVIAIAALLWSLAGLGAFISQETMSAEAIAALPAPQRDLWAGQPGWAVAAYAVAVFGQLAGAVALLLCRRVAVPLFAIAIVGILAQFTYPFLLSDALGVMGPSMTVLPAAILLIAVLLLVYARAAARRGVLR